MEKNKWLSAVHISPDLFSVAGPCPGAGDVELTASMIWPGGIRFRRLGSAQVQHG